MVFEKNPAEGALGRTRRRSALLTAVANIEAMRALLSLGIAAVIAAICAAIFASLLPVSVAGVLLLSSCVLALAFTAAYDSLNVRRAALRLRLHLRRSAAWFRSTSGSL